MSPAAAHLPDEYGVVWSDQHQAPVVYQVVPEGSGSAIRARLLGEPPFEPIPESIRAAITADMEQRRRHKAREGDLDP